VHLEQVCKGLRSQAKEEKVNKVAEERLGIE
jgi:hypothetical protein